MSISNLDVENKKCSHCGETCPDDSYVIGSKFFCCAGCKTVYELLNEKNLSNYYTIMDTPGVSFKEIRSKRFDFLDDEEVIENLIDFRNDELTVVSFFIPQIHCSSCIWLLENLYKLNPGVNTSKVNFLKKEIEIKFFHEKITLRGLVETLSSIGYEPVIQLDSIGKKKIKINKKLYYKIGIAGFCFGNIMLLSFPEYFSIDVHETFYRNLFGYLNLILALPVFFYSASDYFISAYKGLKGKIINIDFPLALGITILFIRSAFEILTYTGAGYFDSMTGLVFFLLIGKVFQEKTYSYLNFERSYKSYFPLAVHVKNDGKEISLLVSRLKVGDRILIRKGEIVPADSILFKGNGIIDYSFVTGESKPVQKVLGELIYAGGRQLEGVIELEVVKEVSQSYLTQLWNNDVFTKKSESEFENFTNKVGKYFTLVVLLIAALSTAYWMQYNSGIALNVLTAVLIVACPCALALSIPFTFGNSIRIFGRNKFYLKNISVIENLSKIKTIVFDKTGTITETGKADIKFIGPELNPFQKEIIKSLVRNSAHPLSRLIYNHIKMNKIYDVENFEELSGRGIAGSVLNNFIKLGSLNFVKENNGEEINLYDVDEYNSQVYLSINNEITGYFDIVNSYRIGFKEVAKNLAENYKTFVLSGDNENERENLKRYFGEDSKLYFRQLPSDKLNFIKRIKSSNDKILMLGDGLNDAGALAQSDVGIAVTENISYFSPACDAILDAQSFKKISDFLNFSRTSVKIIYLSFIISFIYNIVGLSFAIEGMLSPIVAAILMPLSSISVVSFATLATNFLAKRKGL